ncbi:MAG: hypothetical protein H7Y11_09680, partial [Armatimonadetes bacterium]|nr:hypothetical protein [Anaerolineae bacterium]
WGAGDPPNIVNAAHWYDALTLFMKTFNPEFTVDFNTQLPIMGADAVAQSTVEQLAKLKHASVEHMGGVPTLIGEFGLPFDLDDKQAYKTGDYTPHIQALSLYYAAMDANLLHCTLWNYTADNTNARGDGWNDEDLSIFSLDQQTDPANIHSGGRALAAVVRPYARATVGEPLRMAFDPATRVFEFEYQPNASINAPTEIFVPDYHYPGGYTVTLAHGTYEQQPGQVLVSTTSQATQTVRITPS